MKTHRKPDLLFILVVFVGVGFIFSSYIQYTHSNANAEQSAPLAASQDKQTAQNEQNKFILVASDAKSETSPASDPVNKSPK